MRYGMSPVGSMELDIDPLRVSAALIYYQYCAMQWSLGFTIE